MDIIKLKQLLESGAITQAEFEEMSKHIETSEDDASDATNTNNSSDTDSTNDNRNADENANDYDKLERLAQIRVDKALATERKEKSELKRKLERLQKAKLTEQELKQLEIEEKEKAIADREKAIAEKENRLYAVKAIKNAGLDDGSDICLSLVDFVMGEDETEIDEKVKNFKELFQKAVDAEVNKRFRENGYTPKASGSLNGGVNPWIKEQWNVTKQMEIIATNAELAQQLQTAAGK